MIELLVKKGDLIQPFTGGNNAIGDVFFRFDSREELNDALIDHFDTNLKIYLA